MTDESEKSNRCEEGIANETTKQFSSVSQMAQTNVSCHCYWCSKSHWPARLKIIGPVTTRPQCKKREQLKVIRSIYVSQTQSARLAKTQKLDSEKSSERKDSSGQQTRDEPGVSQRQQKQPNSHKQQPKRSQTKANVRLNANRSLSLTDELEISQATSTESAEASFAEVPLVLVLAGGERSLEEDLARPQGSQSVQTVVGSRARCKANSISSSLTGRCHQQHRRPSGQFARCVLCELTTHLLARRASSSSSDPWAALDGSDPSRQMTREQQQSGAEQSSPPGKKQQKKDYLKPGDWLASASGPPKPRRRHSWICR